MKKYIKISIVVIVALIILSAIASVVFKIPTIGKVHGAENEKITIDGVTYIQNTSLDFSYADKGRFLGYVTNEKTTIRVYDVKGENDDYIYALWEWEGSFYEKEKTSNNSNKTITSDLVLEEPPALTVVCGNESIEALRGTTSWQYDNGNGTFTGINSDSMHPLQAKEFMTPLNIIPTPYSHIDPLETYLQWDVTPDNVSVRCWSEDCWGQYGDYNDTSEDIEVQKLDIEIAHGSDETQRIADYAIRLKEENHIYEVVAEWNSSDKYFGTAYYSFYTKTFYDIDLDDLKPIPIINDEKPEE